MGRYASRAQLLNALLHIPICGVLSPDPPIGFECFSESPERFECTTEHIENLYGFFHRSWRAL